MVTIHSVDKTTNLFLQCMVMHCYVIQIYVELIFWELTFSELTCWELTLWELIFWEEPSSLTQVEVDIETTLIWAEFTRLSLSSESLRLDYTRLAENTHHWRSKVSEDCSSLPISSSQWSSNQGLPVFHPGWSVPLRVSSGFAGPSSLSSAMVQNCGLLPVDRVVVLHTCSAKADFSIIPLSQTSRCSFSLISSLRLVSQRRPGCTHWIAYQQVMYPWEFTWSLLLLLSLIIAACVSYFLRGWGSNSWDSSKFFLRSNERIQLEKQI